MKHSELVDAIEAAGGLVPRNWSLEWDASGAARVLYSQKARQLQSLPEDLPARLLLFPGTAQQRLLEASLPWPDHSDWWLLLGQAAGPNWWEERPLYGQRIALTREPSQAAPLAARLQALGAEVVLCPLLQFVAPDDSQPLQAALARLSDFDWLLFTSPNGVRTFFAALWESGRDARALGHLQLGVIGPGTAQALHLQGLRPDIVAAESWAEGFLESLSAFPMQGRRVLLARAQEAREVLPDGLRAQGAQVEVVPTYKTVMPEPPPELQEADLVVLMSSSSVKHLRALSKRDFTCVCIGPVTAETARQLGYTNILCAQRYDLEGVVDLLLSSSSINGSH